MFGFVALLSALAACSGGGPVRPAEQALLPARVQVLAPGVFLLPGDYAPPRQPDGNSVVFEGRDGLLVVDTGRHPEHARRLLALAQSRGLPVRAVLNTHWHLDHIGNNPALRAAFPRAQVLASPAIDAALAGFLADYRAQLQSLLERAGPEAPSADWRAEIARIDAGPALRPDIALAGDTTRTLAGRRLHIGHEGDAVTAGDLWLFDPASGVLAAGDLVTLPAPFFDTACPARWSAALARLRAQPFTRLVPGHGPVLDRDGFDTYLSAYERLRVCAAGDGPADRCVDGWLHDAAPLLPTPRDRDQARDLLGYYLSAVLRGPRRLRHCRSDLPASPDPA